MRAPSASVSRTWTVASRGPVAKGAGQGVVGLYQPNLPGEQGMGLSVWFMGINQKAIAAYLISLYCSVAVLTDDAIAVLENVDVGKYHDYSALDTYK